MLRSSAIDAELAHQLGRQETAHYLGPDAAAPRHLVLAPGSASFAELGERCATGVWIGSLSGLSPSGPGGTGFRAALGTARVIHDGRLGAPLPPLVWEDDWRRLLLAVRAVGRDAVTVALDEALSFGVRAPALLIEPGGSLVPATAER